MPRSKVGKALTKARGPVHGNFAEGATITQGVLALLQSGSSWSRMSAAKKEAAHMIVHKLHRIVTGNPDHKDHWDDIGGYGQLGADDCADAAPVKVRKKYKARAPKVVAQTAVPAKRKYTKRAEKVAARPARKARVAKSPKVAVRARRQAPVLNGAAGHA